MKEKYNSDYTISRFNLLTSLLSHLNRNDENDTDFVIARYFLTHLRQLKDTSIYKIAEECFVSRSSIQRFIKNIGYDTYTQLKASLDEVIRHEDSFKDYTDHTGYRDFLQKSLDAMGNDIKKATLSASYKKLLNIFHDAGQTVILTAEDSSHACKLFQQQILTTGKLIRIITSANENTDLLATLKKDDLLLVCSVTGNFALAINDQIRDFKARKVLITLNHTTAFENTYSFIYYLGEENRISSRKIVTDRNVYNNYGLTFFFDLFFHDCYVLHQNK
ncbi:MAG: hypothetical protein K5648_01240 [Erysipelotrichaceae bacterium]|nr:hypothetical protein [Erysipelotrichaceae bacterium]